MKHFRMLAAGLCSAVLLCGFAIPAYAYSDGGNEGFRSGNREYRRLYL